MGERGTSIVLPEELVAKILMRVPFPFIFKARVLSKSWLARFQPISSSPHDEEEKLRASFQQQLVEWSSTNWKTFCPVFFRQDDFIAYDRASNHWQQMEWLYFLGASPFCRLKWWRLEGAQLLVQIEEMDVRKFPLYVTNILTRSWKRLPPRTPVDRVSSWPSSWLIPMSSQTYKVVVFHDDPRTGRKTFVAEVYDSKLAAWSRKWYRWEDTTPWWRSNWAHFNGFLYRLVRLADEGMPCKVISFNVKEEIFDLLEIAVSDTFTRSDDVGLVVCNGCLLMLEFFEESVTVNKIDLGSRKFLEVTRGPPPSFNFGSFERLSASDGDCIFFVDGARMGDEGVDGNQDGVLAYNMLQDEWSNIQMPSCVRQSYNPRSRSLSDPRHICDPRHWIRHRTQFNSANLRFTVSPDQYEWATSSFQPGLNPFVAV